MFNSEIEITNYLLTESNIIKNLDIKQIQEVFTILLKAISEQKTIYCFGNGGSGSTASHFQNDFNKILNTKLENKFNFICLNDNIATLTAIANDIDYSEVFRFQLEGRLIPGDIIIAISGSGNSENIIKAVDYAHECGNTVIGLTGFDGGLLKQKADVSLHIPIDNMQITEDLHLMYNHLLVSILLKFLG